MDKIRARPSGGFVRGRRRAALRNRMRHSTDLASSGKARYGLYDGSLSWPYTGHMGGNVPIRDRYRIWLSFGGNYSPGGDETEHIGDLDQGMVLRLGGAKTMVKAHTLA